ncbi:GAF domain-containing protein [Acuticoccus sp. MNP-M23]|uniref:GAF domain-containing protein n=1 Tax=Acuticoccus sp. MNP-M23 TaxID=3072793 RepID=UPI002814F9D5|nr:GAF domain-containing protein [Acuticoccus sp. MNP-M23]WMS41394.1 GAF domain-containing protein [Acuticoccus sp. MNP-M23]
MDMTAFTRAIAAPNQPTAAFEALCDMAAAHVGVKLFTVLTIDQTAGLLRRSFSNMPDAYPAKGTKKMTDTRITDTMLKDRTWVLSDGADEVKANFFDHELIMSLGCESCLNVPIVVADEVLGSINLLHDAGHYTPERIEAAQKLSHAAATALLIERQWGDLLEA